ncbi:MAG: copper transporter [Mycobacterium sp.]|nr:copper transporter [Mycobacterium sp.]
MVTLRHHVISLAAVFVALAIGVVLGSGALSSTMVSGLRGDNGVLQKQAGTLTDEKGSLSEKLTAASEFDTQMAGRIVRDALAGKSVVVFRTPDAANEDVDAVARLIGQAGGTVTGTIALTNEFVDANSAAKMSSVVNSPILPAGTQLNATLTDQGSQAGDLLGIALLINRDPKIIPVDDNARDAVLSALRDTGFLTYEQRLGAADTAVIVTGGALADTAGNRGATVARLAVAMAPHGSGVVLAGRDGSANGVSAVAVTRADTPMAEAVTTVDDIGIESGRITTVLALQAMIAGAPPGQYGIGAGAAAVTVPQ